MNRFLRLGAVALLVASAGAADADCAGPVVGVADGDTLRVVCAGRETTVRLRDIDAPEWRQPYGRRARKELSALVHGRDVQLEGDELDYYGRLLATVWIDGINVNREMTRRGYAWAYRRYLRDPALVEDEHEARRERAGLWADDAPMPPWEFRPPPRRR